MTENLNIPAALPVLSAGHHPWGFDRLTGSAAEIVEIPWDDMVAVVGAVA